MVIASFTPRSTEKNFDRWEKVVNSLFIPVSILLHINYYYQSKDKSVGNPKKMEILRNHKLNYVDFTSRYAFKKMKISYLFCFTP